MDTFKVQQSEKRCGVLSGESWIDFRNYITNNWAKQGGYNLSSKSNGPGPFTFNYWAGDKNAVIEFEEDMPAESGSHVASTHGPQSKIEVAKLPYLNRSAIKERPSFLIFDVTGHVIFTIYFGNISRPELHILNPWNLMEGNPVLFKDIYDLLDLKLKYKARKIAVIDVVAELEKKGYKKSINLQEYEKEGFCTLWVGVLASKVIPLLGKPLTLDVYWNQVYKPLLDEIEEDQKKMKEKIPGINLKTVASASTVSRLATGKGRKRKHLAKTKRKRVKWTRRTVRARRSTSRI